MIHSNEASLDVNLRVIWPQWQAVAHRACRSTPPSSRSTSPAGGTPWVRRCSKAEPRRRAQRPGKCPGTTHRHRDIDQAADIVGFTIAEFIPRQVMHLQQIVKGFPLIDSSASR
jgi:hypothetical protein